MMKNILFPQLNGILHGGDYNPEQWLDRPDILEKDIELMKEAEINTVTMGVFSWSVHEPTEGNINFDWLADIMDRLYDNGIYTVLATPTGARPAWLDAKYPSAMRCDEMGVRNHHGVRHNHCMQSPEYREKVRIMDKALAQRFSGHPGLLMWHISNELGGYCYCDTCRQKFQEWLADRYDHDIEKLNKAWWTTFWSHKFNSFDQIDPPYANGENCVLGLNLDWKRFSTWSATDFMRFEIDTLHAAGAKEPTTTNYMEMFYDYDYHYMSQFIDVISWDNYPEMHNNRQSDSMHLLERSFNHALFRSLKPDQPFMMMESAPGVVNWRPYNKYRRPGMHKLISMQALATGSDTVQYFQIRKSRGSSEQWHGAVIDHIGTNDTRIFKEVASLGADLKKISEITGSLSDNKVAILFDWDNRWAIDDAWALSNETKNFDKTCMEIYNEFMSLGVEPDIVSSDGDWSRYKIICAPMLYVLHDGIGQKISDFVNHSGQFMATYFTGYVNKDLLANLGGFPGDGLDKVFGLRSEEIDTLYPEDKVTISIHDKASRSAHSVSVHDYQEMLRDVTAEVLARYENDYLEGTPAITRNTFGNGNAYYVACRTDQHDLEFLYREMLENANIAYTNLPQGVEKHSRFSDDVRYDFYLNGSEDSKTITNIYGIDILTGEEIDGTLPLNKYQGPNNKKGL
ncbi:beta-galactosidase [Pseudobutyrivibrio xylanivorans]|uniref:Beta-galactosidase n=2 Tax=Pseudobutyrivibrio xylanivorans TaxID=185007 RepID=A0A5P6VQP8_PSEXY|nr:beta-galactosidase [Pseudobutyrivibrio xylanivorans]